MIPVEWESMDRHHIDVVEHTQSAESPNEVRVDRGDTAKHPGHRALGPYSLGGGFNQICIHLPPGIDFEVPMGHVIRLVPKLDGFDHVNASALSMGRALSTRIASRYPCSVPTST